MKTESTLMVIFCIFVGFIQPSHGQQWVPSNANSMDHIYRGGNIGIGTTMPAAQVHLSNQAPNFEVEVEKTESPSLINMGFTSPFRPNLLLEKKMINPDGSVAETLGWIIDGGPALDFVRGNLVSGSERRFSINETGARVFGSTFSIGKENRQINLGYSEEGRYIGMGYRPLAGAAFGSLGNGGGAIIFSSPDGKLSVATGTADIMSSGNSTRMTIDAQGSVGIGTVSPSAQLHISGEKPGIRLDNQSGGWWDMQPLSLSGDHTFVLSYGGVDPIILAKENGNVAIGTELTPSVLGNDDISAYRLFVEGGILSNEVRVRTGWSDYVFAPGYELLPLTDVAEHIAVYGHLHNTPSGAQIEASGLELGSMAANQQAKIEELFLHLIEMDTRLKDLEEENTRLRKFMEKNKGANNLKKR